MTKPENRDAVAGPVEPSVRPLLLTEKELLDIVDTLIRDRAYNRPAAVAIGVAVGAAVEAEVRERCAKKPLTRQQIDDVMTQHYPLSSLLREEVDAFEACVRDLERLHGIGA
jgi:hypothetical protein